MTVNLRVVCLILGGMVIRQLSHAHRGCLPTMPFRANFRVCDEPGILAVPAWIEA